MELSDFIGIPFVEKGRDLSGLDCWGLVRLALWELYGIDAPENGTLYCVPFDNSEIADAIVVEKRDWEEKTLGEAADGDCLLLRVSALASHVALVVDAERRRMLHTTRTTGSVIEPYNGLRWQNKIVGVYRHAEL